MKRPCLTIIMVGRNDNYGGDFKERLQHCINWTHKQLSFHEIVSEIIFVNYNPLPETAIEEFINWQPSNEFVSVKIITVPTSIHTTLVNNGKRKNVPVLEYLAKNAGIKRAGGEYVLCINPDILLNESFFKSISNLRENIFYRANRLDFKNSIKNKPTNFIKIFLKGHSYYYHNHNPINYYLLKIKNYFICKWKLNSIRFQNFFERRNWNVYFHNAEYRYHCNVSGDFMLLHRDNWHKLKGYSEQSFISLHVDALMVIQAAALGLKEKVLPLPIYHQEHARRYDANEEKPEYREAYLFFQSEAQKMLAEKKPVIYNDEDWGLNKFHLVEKII